MYAQLDVLVNTSFAPYDACVRGGRRVWSREEYVRWSY